MSYYNRKQLLFNTLQSISQSEVADKLEIVIVDDYSDKMTQRVFDVYKDDI